MKTLLTLLLLGGSVLIADDDRRGTYGTPGVAPVTNTLYKSECGSCHFAYQPGLLPQRSWIKVMQNLADHFQTDASLDANDTKRISAYLKAFAADNAMQFKRSRKIARSIPANDTPVAITQTRYFKHEHDEIPRRLIVQKEVRSLANCTACHTRAEQGYYREHDIKIPNYGKWDDD